MKNATLGHLAGIGPIIPEAWLLCLWLIAINYYHIPVTLEVVLVTGCKMYKLADSSFSEIQGIQKYFHYFNHLC